MGSLSSQTSRAIAASQGRKVRTRRAYRCAQGRPKASHAPSAPGGGATWGRARRVGVVSYRPAPRRWCRRGGGANQSAARQLTASAYPGARRRWHRASERAGGRRRGSALLPSVPPPSLRRGCRRRRCVRERSGRADSAPPGAGKCRWEGRGARWGSPRGCPVRGESLPPAVGHSGPAVAYGRYYFPVWGARPGLKFAARVRAPSDLHANGSASRQLSGLVHSRGAMGADEEPAVEQWSAG